MDQKLWFALRVKPHHERAVAKALCNKGAEDFLPLYKARRRWSDRVKQLAAPLFPGYVFSRFDPRHRLSILTTPGVKFIVGRGKVPEPVADSEIAALQMIVQSGLAAEPWPFLQVGQPVQIDTGPLSGVEVIALKNHHRLVVSVTLLQRSVAVEVDRLWIEPVKASGLRWDAAATSAARVPPGSSIAAAPGRSKARSHPDGGLSAFTFGR